MPPGARARPVLTGWFAEFESLEHGDNTGRHSGADRPNAVLFPRGAAAFAGATYDPTSHYRAAAVFDFHLAQGLTPERLRAVSMRQVASLEREFEALDVSPAVARIEKIPE